jgi:hypothetical protein
MPDDTTPTPGDAARAETARQVVVLLFGAASLVMYVWVQRWAADPDQARTWRMRAAKTSERGWARVAGWSWRRAEQARLTYERESA